jgi:cytochrome c oxidase subunit 3
MCLLCKRSSITALFGILFLIGQLGAWRQLAANGVYLPSNPHSSFFYILTGAHVAHLLGGLLALAYLLIRTLPGSSAPSPPRAIDHDERLAPIMTLNLCATYWHFVDGLWVYLFVVLFVL